MIYRIVGLSKRRYSEFLKFIVRGLIGLGVLLCILLAGLYFWVTSSSSTDYVPTLDIRPRQERQKIVAADSLEKGVIEIGPTKLATATESQRDHRREANLIFNSIIDAHREQHFAFDLGRMLESEAGAVVRPCFDVSLTESFAREGYDSLSYPLNAVDKFAYLPEKKLSLIFGDYSGGGESLSTWWLRANDVEQISKKSALLRNKKTGEVSGIWNRSIRITGSEKDVRFMLEDLDAGRYPPSNPQPDLDHDVLVNLDSDGFEFDKTLKKLGKLTVSGKGNFDQGLSFEIDSNPIVTGFIHKGFQEFMQGMEKRKSDVFDHYLTFLGKRSDMIFKDGILRSSVPIDPSTFETFAKPCHGLLALTDKQHEDEALGRMNLYEGLEPLASVDSKESGLDDGKNRDPDLVEAIRRLMTHQKKKSVLHSASYVDWDTSSFVNISKEAYDCSSWAAYVDPKKTGQWHAHAWEKTRPVVEGLAVSFGSATRCQEDIRHHVRVLASFPMDGSVLAYKAKAMGQTLVQP